MFFRFFVFFVAALCAIVAARPVAVHTAAPVSTDTPKSLSVDCTSGSCSPSDLAKLREILEAAHTQGTSAGAKPVEWEITTSVIKLNGTAPSSSSSSAPPTGGLVRLVRRDWEDIPGIVQELHAEDAARARAAAAAAHANAHHRGPTKRSPLPLPADDEGSSSSVSTDALSAAVAAAGPLNPSPEEADLESQVVHCASAEGGCSDEQLAAMDSVAHTAGWGWLLPIFDLIGRFRFEYNLKIGPKAAAGGEGNSTAGAV